MARAVPLLLMWIPLQGATQQSATAVFTPKTSISIQKRHPHPAGLIAFALCMQDPTEGQTCITFDVSERLFPNSVSSTVV